MIKHHPDESIEISDETLMRGYQRIGIDIDRFLDWQGRASNHWNWWMTD